MALHDSKLCGTCEVGSMRRIGADSRVRACFVLLTSIVVASRTNADPTFVTVGAANNPAYNGPDPIGVVTGRGSVPYEYRIAQTELTTGEWIEFLNTFSDVAAPHPFWPAVPNGYMGAVPDASWSGAGLRWQLVNEPNAARTSVYGISWRMAALYCNWLTNGKQSSTASLITGAYDTTTWGETIDEFGYTLYTDAEHRMPTATYFIPTFDEWLKAAHYDPDRYGPDQGGWWRFSNSSDSPPVPGPPGVGETSAGWEGPNSIELDLPVGSYASTQSPWGLLDTSGGAAEWCEDYYIPNFRYYDGSSAMYSDPNQIIEDVAWFGAAWPFDGAGLRLGSVVPSPGSLGICAIAVVALFRRKRT